MTRLGAPEAGAFDAPTQGLQAAGEVPRSDGDTADPGWQGCTMRAYGSLLHPVAPAGLGTSEVLGGLSQGVCPEPGGFRWRADGTAGMRSGHLDILSR
jgi:hypothetical protein